MPGGCICWGTAGHRSADGDLFSFFITSSPFLSNCPHLRVLALLPYCDSPAPHAEQRAEQRHRGAPRPDTELRGAGRVRCCLSVSRTEPKEAFPSTEGMRGVGDALRASPAPVSLSSRCPERSFQLKAEREGGGFAWDTAPPRPCDPRGSDPGRAAVQLLYPHRAHHPSPGLPSAAGIPQEGLLHFIRRAEQETRDTEWAQMMTRQDLMLV